MLQVWFAADATATSYNLAPASHVLISFVVRMSDLKVSISPVLAHNLSHGAALAGERVSLSRERSVEWQREGQDRTDKKLDSRLSYPPFASIFRVRPLTSKGK